MSGWPGLGLQLRVRSALRGGSRLVAFFFFEVADKAGKSQRDAPEIRKLRARSMRYWVPAEDPLSHCWQLVAAQRSHEKSHDGMATS